MDNSSAVNSLNICHQLVSPSETSLSFIKPEKDQSKNNSAYLGGIRAIGMQLKQTQES